MDSLKVRFPVQLDTSSGDLCVLIKATIEEYFGELALTVDEAYTSNGIQVPTSWVTFLISEEELLQEFGESIRQAAEAIAEAAEAEVISRGMAEYECSLT